MYEKEFSVLNYNREEYQSDKEFNKFDILQTKTEDGSDVYFVKLILNVYGREKKVDLITLVRNSDEIKVVNEANLENFRKSMSPTENGSILKPFKVSHLEIGDKIHRQKDYDYISKFYRDNESSNKSMGVFDLMAKKFAEVARIKLKVINEIIDANYTFYTFDPTDDEKDLILLNANI